MPTHRKFPWECLGLPKNKFLRIGRQKGFISNNEDLSTLKLKTNIYEKANIDREYLEEFITLNKEDVEFISTEDDIEEENDESSEDSSGGGYVSLEEITLP